MLGRTPPMGWNSWNTFAWNINENVVRDMADLIVEKGLKDAGYEYIVIDDCWSLRERDENGKLVADPEKFPSGIKALADYVHSKGLKFGMYSCVGSRTCACYPGAFGHEYTDAQTFADWGVDYLKHDFCQRPSLANGPILYNRMSMALKATGREILFSACNWGKFETEKWIRSTGAHIYRSTFDITDNFECLSKIAMSQIDKLAYSTPGCFNDLDMLVVGMRNRGRVADGGCTDTQYATHFALWCFLQSPLMIGGNLSAMTDSDFKLLKNKELLRINQDKEARPPVVLAGGDRPIFFKHLDNGEYAIAFFNLTEGEATMYAEFFDIGITPECGHGFELRDIMTGEETGFVKDYLGTKVEPFGFKIFRGKFVKKN